MRRASPSGGADSANPFCRELRAMIRSIARVPAERDTGYASEGFSEANADERRPVNVWPRRHAPIGVGY